MDERTIPEPLQEEVEILPKWWGDPEPYRMFERETYFVVNVGKDRGDRRAVVFARPEEMVRIELLDLAGNIVSEGTTTPTTIRVETDGMAASHYLVRISRDTDIERATKAVELRLLPPR